jgi:HK97 family phage portal protein
LTRLRYGLARLLLKASTDFSIVPAWVTTSVLTPTFRSLTRDGYQRSSAFFACVSALAFAFPEPPLLVYDDEGDAGRPLPQHGLRRLLRNPMPTMGEAELFATTMVYMAIGGNAYWHKIRGRGNQVIQLKPYHAGQIMPVPGGPNWIKEYLYDQLGTGGMGATMGTLPRIDPADIVHFKWPSVDPSQPWMSQPPIVAAATEVDADVEASRYVFALLQNDAVPRTVVTIPADRPLLDGEYERIKEQWKERYGGDRRGDVAVLEAGASVSRMSLNLQEMAFEAMAKLPESRIAAVMRVPPIIAGLNVGLDRSTFSNYGEARKAFAQDTLATLWRLVASEVAADLLPEFAGMGTCRGWRPSRKTRRRSSTGR